MSELVVLMDGREAGVVRQARGRLTFGYAASWREAPGAYPLSLSMPLAAAEHPHAAIDSFIWGLLPDNERVLAAWGRRFQVSARNAFALVGQVGEDCPGAVQFVRPERLEAATRKGPAEVAWLSEAEVAERLRRLRADISAWRAPGDIGQFSLAGAQPKTALLRDGSRWGVPQGRTPTTHILKPPTPDLDGHAENEHLCLRLARALGLPTATSEVMRFEDVTAIVLERYDRVRTADLAAAEEARVAANAAKAAMHAASDDARTSALAAAVSAAELAEAIEAARVMRMFSETTLVFRAHQEDLCQALGSHPARKYQRDGGPGPIDIVRLLRAVADPRMRRSRTKDEPDDRRDDPDDEQTFIDALVYNWIIGGTDAHAKNYAVILGAGGLVRLAPLYDVASILPYSDVDADRIKLAMKIGDTYRMRDVGWRQWTALAATLGADAERIVARARAMARELPDRLSDEIAAFRAAGGVHPIVPRLEAALVERARRLAGG
ncbi:type II toxin-antitoxin system HipA family toxin [Salinarimonas sp. NSM]|uniref:type II toxin-antitoxin system HipA family toxin n=1 Tax=Salinarimonas sp. NSM TaxID=3458003 RepID=UPI00403597DE